MIPGGNADDDVWASSVVDKGMKIEVARYKAIDRSLLYGMVDALSVESTYQQLPRDFIFI
jgi:hypothetical protein